VSHTSPSLLLCVRLGFLQLLDLHFICLLQLLSLLVKVVHTDPLRAHVGILSILLRDTITNSPERAPELLYVAIELDLLPNIGDHLLELIIRLTEESLVVLDLPVDEEALLVEALELFDIIEKLSP